MYCPFCSHEETKVLESRIVEGAMRRRRECLKCLSRFTTYERALFNFAVLKRDGRSEPFDVAKLTSSIQRACAKSEPEVVSHLTQTVYRKILNKRTNPIKSTLIGSLVLAELKKQDKMAYVRFATIHKKIEDPKLLERELNFVA
ncbi:transcriptional repressor NrdR [Candidatus Woesearchaeota archaeon]|nr:transcriptional repressor NrdR [Candidatus Woesearchaeota archaeon]